MNQEAKLHHTVPQFYLRGFADSQDRITTVQLPGDKSYTGKVRKTAATNRFYSIAGHPDGADVFEKSLADLEADTAPVLNEIAAGVWPLSNLQREILSLFLAVQYLRDHTTRRSISYIAAQMVRLQVEFTGRVRLQAWVHEQYGYEVSDDEAETLWQYATQPEGPPLTVDPELHIDNIINGAGKLLPFIISRPWTLVRFSRRSLITCDSPVGLVPEPDSGPSDGVGFMTAAAITFPLTRKLGLVMSDVRSIVESKYPVARVRAGKLDSAKSGTIALANFMNDSTVDSASEYLYHHPDDGNAVPSDLPEPCLTTVRGPEPVDIEDLL